MPVSSSTLSGLVDAPGVAAAFGSQVIGSFQVNALNWLPQVVRFGGSLYVAAMTNKNTVSSQLAISVWKTTDNGNSWSRLDITHEPSSNGTSTWLQGIASYYPGSGATLYIVFLLTTKVGGTYTTEIRLVNFTMGPDTFGSVVTGGPNVTGATTVESTITNAQIVLLSTGAIVVVYNVLGSFAASHTISLSEYASGTWQYVNTTIAGTSTILEAIQVDSSDRAHIFWSDLTGLGFQYRQWSAPTLSSVQTPISGLFAENCGLPVYLASSDTIAVPVAWIPASNYVATVVYGTPSSTPTFTQSTAYTAPTGLIRFVFLCTDPTQSLQFLFWQVHTSIDTVLYSKSTDGGLTWSAPSVFFAGNPPATLLSHANAAAPLTGISAQYVSPSVFDVLTGADVQTTACIVGLGYFPARLVIRNTSGLGIGVGLTQSPGLGTGNYGS